MRGSNAGIAQLVEHDLAKVGVASSSLVSRSRHTRKAPTRSGPCRLGGRCSKVVPGASSCSQPVNLCYHGQLKAGIAQLVEHDLAKVGVASSSLVSRSSFFQAPATRGLLLKKHIAQRPGGRVVMQRTANPRTPVRFRPWPPLRTRRLLLNPPLAGFLLPVRQGGAKAPCYDSPPADPRPGGETGRRKGLKIPPPQGDAGSIPAPGTPRLPLPH